LRPYAQERETFTKEREALQSAADSALLEGAALREELAAAADAAMAEAAMSEAAAMAAAASVAMAAVDKVMAAEAAQRAAQQSLAELKVRRCKLRPVMTVTAHDFSTRNKIMIIAFTRCIQLEGTSTPLQHGG
jgi:hypothetical protein